MARLEFGRLTEAWTGEATDFTPLLAEQIDVLGEAIGVELAPLGESEVPVAGGRRIDIVASDANDAEMVIENQYGRADHDHLTRGLAYAVARRATGLVVVAEEHRDEFKAVAEYLNDLAELDTNRGIPVWLVEARAVRIGDSAWAPLFTVVVEPHWFTASVGQARRSSGTPSSIEQFWARFESDQTLTATRLMIAKWEEQGHRWRLGPNHVVLMAEGPSRNGFRSVVTIYPDGRVMVPFYSYAGVNSGIAIDALCDDAFRTDADSLFGFTGHERLARTTAGWLTPARLNDLDEFCRRVATAYAEAMVATSETADATDPTHQA